MRVEVPTSWFMMIWYGSIEISWRRGQVNLLETQCNAHISTKLIISVFHITCNAETHYSALPLSLHPCQNVCEFVYLCKMVLSSPGRVAQSRERMWPRYIISSRQTSLVLICWVLVCTHMHTPTHSSTESSKDI